jgi:hypothetical protein
MAQISSYPLLTPQLGDKVLGSNTTDAAGNSVAGNPTVQYNFTDIKTLVDQSFVQQLTSFSTLIVQDATGAATPVTFGTLQDLDNVKLEANGTLTLKTLGTYYITLEYMYGQRVASANETKLLFNVTQGGVQLGSTTSIRFKDNTVTEATTIIIPLMVTPTLANQVYKFQFAETGAGGARLVQENNTVTGFANSQTAVITISKLI